MPFVKPSWRTSHDVGVCVYPHCRQCIRFTISIPMYIPLPPYLPTPCVSLPLPLHVCMSLPTSLPPSLCISPSTPVCLSVCLSVPPYVT